MAETCGSTVNRLRAWACESAAWSCSHATRPRNGFAFILVSNSSAPVSLRRSFTLRPLAVLCLLGALAIDSKPRRALFGRI